MSRASDDDGADRLEREDIGMAATLPDAAESGNTPVPSQPTRGTLAEAIEPARVFAELFQHAAEPQQLGRYAVLGTLGQGGMGVVLRAYDRELDRPVALKVLRRELGKHHTIRLRREAQAMAKLSHPNVVQVYEVGEIDGQTFVAMELVKGKTPHEWLQQAPRPDWRACVRLFVQLGAGLAAAHDRGLVHRDFKPGNAIIDDKGRARVLDFGLARQAGDDGGGDDGGDDEPTSVSHRTQPAEHEPVPLEVSITTTGAVLGTPAYMPPEQMAGARADARSDQFSFCVSLFEAVYGERPFEGSSMAALMVSMKRGTVRSPPKRSKVPAALRKALLRGLAIDPAKRWPSMVALLEQLRSLVDPRRGRWLALAVGVGLLAIGGGLGVDRFAAWASRCSGARAQLDGIWDEARKREVQAAILGTELAYAPGTWERVEQRLDEHTDAWIDQHTEVCEATAVRGEQSEEVQALRMGCLHERRSHVRATVDVLARADAEVAEHAVQAVASLPGLSRCADVDALRAEVPPPEDPAVAEQVNALRERLIAAKAKEKAGKPLEGLAVAEAVVTEAKTLDYEPLMARAWLLQGALQANTGDYEGALATLRPAYDAAVARRMTSEAADAAITLVYILGYELARHDEARRWAEHADPLSRADGTDHARAGYVSILGAVAASEGKYDEARGYFERALAILEEALEPDLLTIARPLTNLGNVAELQGRFDEARDIHQRVLAIFEKALGPDHPHVAGVLNNLGNVAESQGKLDEARDFLERALAIDEKALGPDHPDVANPLNNLGNVVYSQGKLDEARDLYQRALAIREKALGPDHPQVASLLGNLGNLAEAQGKLDEARDLHVRALAIYEKAVAPDHPSVAYPLCGLGRVLLGLAEPIEALRLLERALAIRTTHETEPARVAETHFLLARALWVVPATEGRDQPRAHRLAEQARDAWAKLGPGSEADLAEVEQWLAEHRVQ